MNRRQKIKEDSSSKPYGIFARIYDDVMSAVPYKFWHRYLEFLRKYHGFDEPSQALELACGTGSMMKLFLKKGMRVSGVDLSPSMLEQAGEKLQCFSGLGELEQQDIRELDMENKYDLIYSVFDSMNYILSFEGLEKVFRQVRRHLRDDGLFIFDMNTRARIKEIEEGYTRFEGDYFTCQWQDSVCKEDNLWEVELTIKLDEYDGFFYEKHQETSYPLEDIKASLLDSGFNFVRCYEGYSLRHASEMSSRVYFLAGITSPLKPSMRERVRLRMGWNFYRLINFLSPF